MIDIREADCRLGYHFQGQGLDVIKKRVTRPEPAHCGLEHQLEESRAKRSQSSEQRKRRCEEMRLKHNLKL